MDIKESLKKVRRIYLKAMRMKRKIVIKIYPLLPKFVRWWIAHKHHKEYKFNMLEKYGEKDYLELYDKKALIDLKKLQIDGNFKNKTVVDIGCGLKGVLGVIKAKRKIGIDPSITDELKKKINLPEDIEYLSDKAESISLEDESVHVVFMINTFNHVQDPKKVLSEINRILKKEGLLLFEIYIEPYALGHTHKFNQFKLIKILSKRFDVIRTYYVCAMNHELTGEWVNPRWGGVFKKCI